MEVYVVQITNRLGEKIDISPVTLLKLDTPVEVGYTFWCNNISDDKKSGMYKVIGTIKSA